jgi:UDP-glucose 4-epimerase
MANVLVIGGNGFLGSHLVDELVVREHSVAVLDRFSAVTPQYDAAGVEQVVGDLLNTADVARAVAGRDYVFHFVSTTTPASAENDPTLDLRTNVAASVDLFAQCADAGVQTVYFASTGGAIYGEHATRLLSEETLPQPVSPYAIGKLTIEHYLRYFERKNGLRSVSLRISNPYGPRQRVNTVQGVIPIFLRRMSVGLPLTVYGDGSMVRDFLYVTDAARMVAETVGRPTEFPVYNVGSGIGVSVNELVDILSEVTGITPVLEHAEVPPTFIDHVVLDTARYRGEFGDATLTSLRKGCARTWHSIQGERS